MEEKKMSSIRAHFFFLVNTIDKGNYNFTILRIRVKILINTGRREEKRWNISASLL